MSKQIYPDWVLKYKPKGVYVTKKADAYYLYRAHSQRIKGTNKVKRIFDGYIGRVTEKDGFIPVKDKITGDIIVYDFGCSCFLYSLCFNIYKGFKKTSPSYADTIFASAIFQTLSVDITFLPNDALYFLLPGFSYKQLMKSEVIEQIQRCSSMIASYISDKVVPDDFSFIMKNFPSVHVIYVNHSYRLSAISDDVLAMLDKYNVEINNYVKNF